MAKTHDSRVQAAIAHWGPRFVYRGVDFNDFIRTTASIERWEQWLDAWCALAGTHRDLAQQAESRGWRLAAGHAYRRAALCYHFARFLWTLDEREYRATSELAVTCHLDAYRLLDPRAEHLTIPFEGTSLLANVRFPPEHHPAPLVILIPGLDSTKEEFFLWEDTFLARGLATLSLDGPGQGESAYTTHMRPDYEVAIAAVLTALAPRPELDLTAVGVVGVSLGGYYAPRALAIEPRLLAGVALGGPYRFDEPWEQYPELTRAKIRFHTGATSEEQARERIAGFDLAGITARIAQPLLVVNGADDRLIPATHAERLAAEVRHAELLLVPDGNHCCTNYPYRHSDYIADWMAERLHAATHPSL